MALIQSVWAKGQQHPARPQTAFAEHGQLFIHDISAGVASGDILELAVLPPYARIIDAKLVNVGSLGAGSVDVGIMTGQTGNLLDDAGAARTCGNELFDDAAVTAGLVAMTKTAGVLLASSDKDRSIGVLFNGAVTAGAGKQIGLLLTIAQY